MQRYNVVVSGEARQMLMECVYFLASVNPDAARLLLGRIKEGIASLAQMPERYPYLEPENRESRYRKLFVPNWYLIIYKVEQSTVYVEYVLDCRQDYQWLLR